MCSRMIFDSFCTGRLVIVQVRDSNVAVAVCWALIGTEPVTLARLMWNKEFDKIFKHFNHSAAFVSDHRHIVLLTYYVVVCAVQVVYVTKRLIVSLPAYVMFDCVQSEIERVAVFHHNVRCTYAMPGYSCRGCQAVEYRLIHTELSVQPSPDRSHFSVMVTWWQCILDNLQYLLNATLDSLK